MKIHAEVRRVVAFDEKDVKEFVGNNDLTYDQMEEIATILALNLEGVGNGPDDVTPISSELFNDAFCDMQEDLIEHYGANNE